MVLIRAHQDKAMGEIWFLAQNFWKNMYIWLVLAKHLASCQAWVSFVPADQDILLSENFNLVDGFFIEIDMGVEECEELFGEEHYSLTDLDL